jgi:hypothetical protein
MDYIVLGSMDYIVIDWDGKHVPEPLRTLAPGRYIVAPHFDLLNLTEEDVTRPYDAINDLELGNDQTDASILTQLARLSPGPYLVESAEPITDLPVEDEQAIRKVLARDPVAQVPLEKNLDYLLNRYRARR